jgi:hypothetical protein
MGEPGDLQLHPESIMDFGNAERRAKAAGIVQMELTSFDALPSNSRLLVLFLCSHGRNPKLWKMEWNETAVTINTSGGVQYKDADRKVPTITASLPNFCRCDRPVGEIRRKWPDHGWP